MQTENLCNDERLMAMLDSDTQADQFAELLQHVERCGQCQKRLDQLAANDSYWDQASQVLSGFASSDPLRSQPGQIAARPSRLDDVPVAWNESMARQLLSPASHPEMLGRIGRYEVERLIGSGGMGIVFKAIDSELNRPVAIKILAPYLAGSGAARQRFAREAKAAAAVVHEHVVPIHNVETDGQSPFLVMRYVAGESLQARIDRTGALDLCQVLRIANQVASGLHAAHSHGLVHRDIKPSNILVESGVERSLITDFGLARAADDASLTNTGHHPGTPQFMSPEQARGDSIDARSDLFSLGSVMYTMCTGRPPFRAETSYGILRRITDTEPRPIQEVNPQIPDWLCGLIAKLMSKSPDQRYQSAEQIGGLLELCLAHVQHPTTHKLPAEVAQLNTRATSSRLAPFTKLISAGAILLVIAVIAWSLLSSALSKSPESSTIVVAKPDSPSSQPKGKVDLPPETQQAQQKEIQRPQPHPQHQQTPKPQLQTAQVPRKPRKQPPIEPADRIRNQLAQQTSVNFSNLPFQEAVAELMKSSDVRAHFVNSLFEEANIDCSKPCSLQSTGSISSLLNRICEHYDASYIVRDTTVEILPLVDANQSPTLRYYDLAFVLPDSRETQSVINAIQQLIDPDNWAINGGNFSISLVDSVIVVRTTELAHQQIERLLSKLILHPISQ